MKKILSIFAFLAFSVAAFAQAGNDRILYENTSGTAAGVYTVDALKTYINTGVGSGTVTSASVVSANGFAGTVATATTTPAITLTTTLSNNVLPKSNGTGFVPAVAGTDYVIPSGTVALATNVTTNANLTGEVTSIGNAATIANLAVTGAKLAVGSVDLASTKVTGLLPNANLANNSTTINGVARTLGASTTIDLASVTGQGATTATASTFSGGLTSSGATTISGVYTKSAAATVVITPATTITATGNIAAAGGVTPVNSATAIVLTIPAGLTIGTEKDFQLARASTGQVTFTASGSETLNGGSAAGSFVVGANSQGVTVKLYKTSATDWAIGLRW